MRIEENQKTVVIETRTITANGTDIGKDYIHEQEAELKKQGYLITTRDMGSMTILEATKARIYEEVTEWD